MPVVCGGEDVEVMVVCMMVVVYRMVVVCMVEVLKEERKGGREGFRAMTRMVGVSQSWAALYPCAEPTREAAENLSHVSSGVLVTVKSMIYLNKEYSVFGNAICARKLTATTSITSLFISVHRSAISKLKC